MRGLRKSAAEEEKRRETRETASSSSPAVHGRAAGEDGVAVVYGDGGGENPTAQQLCLECSCGLATLGWRHGRPTMPLDLLALSCFLVTAPGQPSPTENICKIVKAIISNSDYLSMTMKKMTVIHISQVNAANERMLGGGGVDGAIHRTAGPELVEACRKVPEVKSGVRCPTGEARITPAFKLPVSRVIHTVGPIYDMDKQPEVSLNNAYTNSLKLAKQNGIQYIALPAISCGVYRYPPKEASKIAVSTAQRFSNDIKEVHFVLFSDELYDIWRETAKEFLSQFEK
uniref:Macro domain-containing protein n=1 Tax=Oryza meridionalis TaxID=40149 RepID=A0A0E0D055_9ORYZ